MMAPVVALGRGTGVLIGEMADLEVANLLNDLGQLSDVFSVLFLVW